MLSPDQKPLLTVLIPTYKRARHVEAQTHSVIVHLLDSESDVELVVVNNRSPDNTEERLSRFTHPRFRLVTTADHYDTAEENMMRALQYVRGEYVWFLGDDEVLNPPALHEVMTVLRERKLDCLIFNSPTVTNHGAVELLQPLPMHGRVLEASIGDIVELIGILYTFAGFSNLIHRTSKLSSEAGLEWLNNSRIYSHVAWFIDSHKDSQTALFNLALVFYRQNDYSDGHWDRVAEKLGVQNLYFWSLGIARLLDELAKRGAISYWQAGQILEVGRAGNRYKLINDLVMKIYQQMRLWIESGESRQAFTFAEIRQLVDFCIAADPSLFNLMVLIEDGHAQLQKAAQFGTLQQTFHSFEARFHDLFGRREAEGQFVGRYVGRLHGYDCYRMPMRYVGVPASSPELREALLSQVDQPANGDTLISADDLHELATQAQLATRLRREARMRQPIAEPLPVLAAPQPQLIVHGIEPQLVDALTRRDDEIRTLHGKIEALLQSSSWGLTAPIRMLAARLKRRR